MSSPSRPLRPTPLLAVRGVNLAFIVVSVLEIVLQLGLLALIVFGLVSPDLVSTSVTLLAVYVPVFAVVALAGRVLGTVALLRQVHNLRRLGVEGLRLSVFSVGIFWLPLLLRPAWLLPWVLLPQQPGAHAIWAVALLVAVLGALPLHEVWRASAPDQLEHWRYVPLSGPVVGWTVAAVVDAAIPLVQPFAVWASIVVVRRLASRVRDKQVVVHEVDLLASRAEARELSLHAESAP